MHRENLVTTFTLVASFHAHPDTRAELAERLQEMVVLTRPEPGCLRYDLHVDRDDDHTFVFVETWSDDAAWDTHMETAHVRSLLADAPRLTTEGVSLLKLRPI